MRIVTLEEREGNVGKIIAQFEIGGEDFGPQSRRPDIATLVEIREALYDYIVKEKAKVEEILASEEARATRDADLISGVVDVQNKSLAAAEAHAAHVAAMAEKAAEAVAKAQEQVNEAKAKAANQ